MADEVKMIMLEGLNGKTTWINPALIASIDVYTNDAVIYMVGFNMAISRDMLERLVKAVGIKVEMI